MATRTTPTCSATSTPSIAYSTWQYYEATGDTDFLAQYGAEIIFEIAKFWSSLATYDRADDRFDLRGVMGPDEYHDGYPWRDEPGLDNNAYTNVMVVWVLIHALECVDVLPDRRRGELLDLLDITREELERWEHLSRKMRLCWHDDGILSQFEGYERLEEFPWADYAAKYGDIARLDRILEAEGDSPNRYRLSKQADVLMLVLPAVRRRTRGRSSSASGTGTTPRLIPRTIDYYLRRTSHGSTLSKVVHAWLLARRDRRQAWEYFLQALDSDVADVQGGTTREGIHLGAMAGHRRPAAAGVHRAGDPRRQAVAGPVPARRPAQPGVPAALPGASRDRGHRDPRPARHRRPSPHPGAPAAAGAATATTKSTPVGPAMVPLAPRPAAQRALTRSHSRAASWSDR